MPNSEYEAGEAAAAAAVDEDVGDGDDDDDVVDHVGLPLSTTTNITVYV